MNKCLLITTFILLKQIFGYPRNSSNSKLRPAGIRFEFGSAAADLSDLGSVGAAALTDMGIAKFTVTHHNAFFNFKGSGGPYGALRTSFGLTQTEYQLAG